jgi:type I restriction enzyme S subunit
MQEELPVGWSNKNLHESITKFSTNQKKVKQKEYLNEGLFPVIDQGQDLVGGYLNDESKAMNTELPVIVFGDHTRIIKFINFNFVPGADGVKVIKPFSYYFPKLFFYFLKVIANKIEDRGYSRHFQFIEKSKIPLPPLNEQKRIVAKIEELFSEVDQGIANLQRAQTQLKTYRQSVLKHAFEGKLTAQWRAENQDNLEPAEALLERIQEERENFYQQQCEEAKTNGIKKPKKPKDISLIKIEGDKLNIPNAWLQTNIETFLSLTRKGLKTGPFGMALKKSEHQHSGFPVLGIENIGFCKFIDGNKIFITDKKAKELSSFEVYPKDVIVSRSGTVGEICVVPDRVKEARISSNLMRICLNSEVVDSNYFVYQFQGAVSILNEIKELCKGSSREFLNQSILNSLNFTLPPFSEQNQIVQEIESRLSVCDKMEQTIEESLKKAEALKQSILKKAFSGKLVPQDPNDEPASVLLERIKDEKESLAKESKKAGRKKK